MVFARDSQGRFPALDYMDGTAATSDPTYPMTDQQLRRIDGMLQAVRTEGLAALRGSDSFVEFVEFVGEDAKDGMCELRIVANRGHRFLCFQRGDRQLVVTHAFRKPPQAETPHEAKTAARTLLAQHEAASERKGKNDSDARRRRHKR